MLKRNRSLFRLAALLAALATVGSPPMQSAAELDAQGVLQRLQRWLDETRDLRARFEQTLVSGAFGEGLEESGLVYLQRPGRMRWDYEDPEVKVALVRDARTWLYLEDERQLWTGRLQRADALLPTLMAAREPLDSIFEASLLETPRSGAAAYLLRLAPRAESESFEEVVLTLQAPRFALREVEVLDLAGNRMRYRFSELERNHGLPASLFEFEVPPGTEILATGGDEEGP
jgi:outer membrane lipoprotein carrier protein